MEWHEGEFLYITFKSKYHFEMKIFMILHYNLLNYHEYQIQTLNELIST